MKLKYILKILNMINNFKNYDTSRLIEEKLEKSGKDSPLISIIKYVKIKIRFVVNIWSTIEQKNDMSQIYIKYKAIQFMQKD